MLVARPECGPEEYCPGLCKRELCVRAGQGAICLVVGLTLPTTYHGSSSDGIFEDLMMGKPAAVCYRLWWQKPPTLHGVAGPCSPKSIILLSEVVSELMQLFFLSALWTVMHRPRSSGWKPDMQMPLIFVHPWLDRRCVRNSLSGRVSDRLAGVGLPAVELGSSYGLTRTARDD